VARLSCQALRGPWTSRARQEAKAEAGHLRSLRRGAHGMHQSGPAGDFINCSRAKRYARRACTGGSGITDTFDREAATRLAELANVKREHDLATAGPDYLDGYQAGYEKAAAIIRRGDRQS